MPEPNSSPNHPTTDQLAGHYVVIEGEEKVYVSGVPHRSPPVKRGPGWIAPTTDQLAGAYVEIVAEEKVHLPPPPPPSTPGSPA
jgi:hypothetical protein